MAAKNRSPKKPVASERQAVARQEAARAPRHELAALPQAEPAFLAAEMGAGLGDENEPLVVRLDQLALQPALRQMALRLLEDFQTKRSEIQNNLREDGLTEEDLWTPGITETLSDSSEENEIQQYRLKLQHRADFLQAALEETLLAIEALKQTRAGALNTQRVDSGDRDTE